MDLLSEIKTWIDNQGAFSDAVKLYHRAGLRRSASRWNMVISRNTVTQADKDAISVELSAYLAANSYTDSPVSASPRYPRDAEPPEVQQLREKARELRKKYSLLHAQLASAQSNEERYEIAREIMEEVIPQEDRVWDSIRRFEQSGIIPEPQTAGDLVQQVVKKVQRIFNLRTRASKYKKQLTSLEGKAYQEVNVKYMGILAELTELEQELNITQEADYEQA